MLVFRDLDNPKLTEMLKNGAVGVLPTDTVYGIVCSAANEQAVNRLYELKRRENNPGTLIGASIEQFVELGIPRRYLKAVEQYWPNPISIETPHDLKYLHRGTGRQALRIPKFEQLTTLLEKTGALQTSSANHTGKPTSNTLDDAKAYFGDQVDFYVEGGDLSNNKPSTIIRIIDDAVEVVREGAIKINEKGEIQP